VVHNVKTIELLQGLKVGSESKTHSRKEQNHNTIVPAPLGIEPSTLGKQQHTRALTAKHQPSKAPLFSAHGLASDIGIKLLRYQIP